MQVRVFCGLFGLLFSAFMVNANAGQAGSDSCCAARPGRPVPKVVYGLPPAPFVIPPTGYVLDPSDAVPPFYRVDRRGRFAYAPFARLTHSEGGIAFNDAYPFGFPYVADFGEGVNYDLFERPFGAPPYAAYRYRTAPYARIIHLDRARDD